ncbi:MULTISPECIES: hypothetical protein [Aminobacter]|jgi:hypothetical protein|uniref:Uncharacterized protein n=1 Tax=Aminobacter aminovorans TaxID=83263 RepID=A0AAC9ASC5_AMIAI|nr:MULTISPECIES: hypothetical protein [Aminobacter]AMS43186.1 hypothetical protein AA2016_4270 [Aminobacter aminovorans]MBB3706267.1 hypothetical protein [Aminobacter aminovorans]
MNNRIIFPSLNGGVCVLIPAGKSGIPIEEIARKDVPAGVPYRIINVTDLPEDRSERELWSADFAKPDGHGIGSEAWFAEQEAGQ